MKIIIFTADWSTRCDELKSRLLTIDKSIPHEELDVMKNVRQTVLKNIKVLPTVIKVDDDGVEVSRLIGLKGIEILTDFFN